MTKPQYQILLNVRLERTDNNILTDEEDAYAIELHDVAMDAIKNLIAKKGFNDVQDVEKVIIKT